MVASLPDVPPSSDASVVLAVEPVEPGVGLNAGEPPLPEGGGSMHLMRTQVEVVVAGGAWSRGGGGGSRVMQRTPSA